MDDDELQPPFDPRPDDGRTTIGHGLSAGPYGRSRPRHAEADAELLRQVALALGGIGAGRLGALLGVGSRTAGRMLSGRIEIRTETWRKLAEALREDDRGRPGLRAVTLAVARAAKGA